MTTFSRLLSLIVATTISVVAVAQTPVDSVAARDTITDARFELPQAYVDNLEKHLDDWYLLNYTVYEPQKSRTTHDVNYPDSVYRRRLSDLETVIDMPYNQIVRNCIDRYMRNSRNSLSAILGRSTRFMPIFEQALEEAPYTTVLLKASD